MKIKGTQDSHILIPKLLLKGFSTPVVLKNKMGKQEKPNMVYKLDMNGKITQVNIKKENTELGYYEDTIETELLPSIETKFGDIKSKILDNLKLNNEIISFNNEEVITVQKFCLLCMIRSKSFVSEVENKSLFIDFYDNSPQNVVLYQYFKSPELLDKYIVANNLSYVKNETNINYILPRFYVVGIKQKNGVIDFFIPISPKILIRLTTEKTINKQIFYIEKMTDFDVDNFNKLAIFYELKHNNQAVYAKNKNDLERYVDYLKELKK